MAACASGVLIPMMKPMLCTFDGQVGNIGSDAIECSVQTRGVLATHDVVVGAMNEERGGRICGHVGHRRGGGAELWRILAGLAEEDGNDPLSPFGLLRVESQVHGPEARDDSLHSHVCRRVATGGLPGCHGCSRGSRQPCQCCQMPSSRCAHQGDAIGIHIVFVRVLSHPGDGALHIGGGCGEGGTSGARR